MPRREELDACTIPELKVLCLERGLAVGGKKEDLVNRILVHEGHPKPEGDLRFMSKPDVAALSPEEILAAVQTYGSNQLARVPPKRKTREFMTSACELDPKSLKHCSKLGGDSAFVAELIENGVKGVYQYATRGVRLSPSIAAAAVESDPIMFLSAPAACRNDPELVLPLLAKPPVGGELAHGDLYLYAGRDIQRTPKACLLAATNCSQENAVRVLMDMPSGARRSQAIMTELIKKIPDAMGWAGANLKDSLPFARIAAAANGRVLPFLDRRWQDNKSVVATALAHCPEAALLTTHRAEPYLDYFNQLESDYEASKESVIQLLCVLKRPTADGKLVPVASLRGHTRAQNTIFEYLMKCTTHPLHNAMTHTLITKIRESKVNLERAVQIQARPR